MTSPWNMEDRDWNTTKSHDAFLCNLFDLSHNDDMHIMAAPKLSNGTLMLSDWFVVELEGRTVRLDTLAGKDLRMCLEKKTLGKTALRN